LLTLQSLNENRLRPLIAFQFYDISQCEKKKLLMVEELEGGGWGAEDKLTRL
jgi:hypothetical protein